MSTTTKKSCYFYRFKKETGRVEPCDGDVKFDAGDAVGTCQDCGREVPVVAER